MSKAQVRTIIIEGITQDGRSFRPSDWAERISGNLSTFANRRMVYSPMLRPAVRNGVKCVLLDPRLEESIPALYEEIFRFAHFNGLRLCDAVSNRDEPT